MTAVIGNHTSGESQQLRSSWNGSVSSIKLDDYDHTIIHPGALSVMLKLLPSVEMREDSQVCNNLFFTWRHYVVEFDWLPDTICALHQPIKYRCDVYIHVSVSIDRYIDFANPLSLRLLESLLPCRLVCCFHMT
mgnify:CR=1 FL=1